MLDQPAGAVSPDELGLIADQVSLGLIRFDARPRVVQANRVAHAVLERRPGSLLGRSPMEAFLDHRLEELVRGATQGESGARESAPGGRRQLMVRARPAEGGGAWVTIENVTELRHLQRMRSEFIDNLSHELRTPLTNVRLLTEMLLEDLAATQASPRLRERAATIDVETGHLVQMVNELLDLSRIEQSIGDVRRDEVAVGPLVAGSLGRLRAFAERQGVSLVADVPSGIPPVRGDEERLDQLLVNLLHNAIKFSAPGDTVTVGAVRDGSTVAIVVRDEGEGIPRDEQARVFERFYKVDRARRRGLGGTGLGLTISRHIAEAHGGRLWLESTDGVGSTFSFCIPVA